MTKEEFIDLMKQWGVSSRFYSVDGKGKEYAVNLEKLSTNLYSVYYLERGERIESKNFTKIEDAYDEVARIIKGWIDVGFDVK